jgi:hypothetical protein
MHELVIEQGPETGQSNGLSPPLTGASMKSSKVRSIDQYISSLDEANNYTRPRTTDPVEERPASRTARARSRPRDESQSRGRSGVRYIRPAKRSPSSPVPMSPEDAGIYTSSKADAATTTETYDDERFYKMSIASPVATESVTSARTTRSRARHGTSKTRSSSKAARRTESPEGAMGGRSRVASRASNRRVAEDRGRSANRGDNSPASPQPMHREEHDVTTDHEPIRSRNRSTSRQPTTSRREPSTERRAPRDRSVSRRAPLLRESSRTRSNMRDVSPDSMTSGRSGVSRLRPTTMSRRELAAKELADRRLSLARRPSAPVIPDPGELAFRPMAHGRSNTDDMLNTLSMYRDPIQRSQTADPEVTKRYSPTNRVTGATSTPSMPIGLPANPRAMRHPRYMTADPNERDEIPAVPSIPDNLQYRQTPHGDAHDNLGPLLPSTTFGQPIVPPSRAASAPPQDLYVPQGGLHSSPTYSFGRRPSLGSQRGHQRQNTSPDVLPPTNYKRISPPPITASIAETIHESDVVVIDVDQISSPPVLSQLQHLATPPPPPPPPLNLGGSSNSAVISIAIDENPGDKPSEVSPFTVPTTTSPHAHRRGRGSVSDNLGMTFKRVTDRMRSTSRSRNKSPPMMRAGDIAPYESVPEFAYPRGSNQRSPSIDGNNHDNYFNNIPPPPPPPPQPMEQVISPTDSQAFYKHPKEIRANMPPATLQPGVYVPDNTPMI